ncbi:MAG: hypothetical protein K9J16_07500 [Melioribacteraceae bacterium]|nr:hypothetical protein [Melioribacteraceae bacterium]MCF8353438.1 hypothetical protein [Melioribacteraceae bacterium]MCF8393926.1 hypothetical protein [Melioribacteraceae bacterium]MCF8418999.1 hypothetical protein [Melioribacteraceae bacterium]
MHFNRKNLTCSYIVVFIFLSNIVNAQSSIDQFKEFQLQALKDLPEVGVYVWGLEDLDLGKNINNKVYEDFIRMQLETAGIKVIDFSEANRLKGSPSLELQLRVAYNEDQSEIAYSAILRFIQDVILDRDRTVLHYSSITWERDAMGITNPENLGEKLKTALAIAVLEFVKDYKSVN